MVFPQTSSRAARLRFRLERFASGLAVLLGAVSLATAAAYWAWYAWGPKPAHIPVAPVVSPVAALRAMPLFGSAPLATLDRPEEIVLDGELRLLGLIAESEGQGYAVFRVGQGTYIARVGDSVAGQAMLIRIEPNAITLRENSGAERRVVLRREETAPAPKIPSTAESASTTRTVTASPGKVTVCVPAGFKGSIVRLNTELVQGALLQPETFYALLDAKDGRLAVRADNGHAAMLGLKAGDVLQSANGIALTRAEDISGAILKPLAGGQSVLLKGLRDGQGRDLLLVNASVCV